MDTNEMNSALLEIAALMGSEGTLATNAERAEFRRRCGSVDVNTRFGSNRGVLLHWAVTPEAYWAVLDLVDMGADLNAADMFGATALWTAVASAADVAAQTQDEYDVAFDAFDPGMVKLLFRLGADPLREAVDENGRSRGTANDLAKKYNWTEVIELFA